MQPASIHKSLNVLTSDGAKPLNEADRDDDAGIYDTSTLGR